MLLLLLFHLLYQRASPPSFKNAAMRLPQPRLGQRNSVSSISQRSITIATANEALDCRIKILPVVIEIARESVIIFIGGL